MKLIEKIFDCRIVYTFRKDEGLAFEIALLYYVMAKRKKAKQKIDGICDKIIFWLEKAGVSFPEYLAKLSPEGQLDAIELVLVNNKAKGIWNYSSNWTFSLTSAYSRTSDYLLSRQTYTFAPGFGFIFRWEDRLRLDFDYTHSQSYQGLSTEKNNYALRGKYSVSEFVDFVLRLTRETSVSPDYKLTDISANLEITF